jgi:ribosomal protein S18 acetylase RimI-like enzyme
MSFLFRRIIRRGNGKRLLQAVEGICQARSMGWFTLLTNKEMPAFEFYRKNGFSRSEICFSIKNLQSSELSINI